MTVAHFQVVLAPQAERDLERLLDLLLEKAQYNDEVGAALAAIAWVEAEMLTRLAKAPWLYRPAIAGGGLRELVMGGPGGGYVALYDIPSDRQVTILSVRHQLEDDYL